jgi:hypothetical protein
MIQEVNHEASCLVGWVNNAPGLLRLRQGKPR